MSENDVQGASPNHALTDEQQWGTLVQVYPVKVQHRPLKINRTREVLTLTLCL